MIRSMMCTKIIKIGDTEVKNLTFEEATELLKKYTDVKDDDIIQELQELDISNMTPMDAMNTLYRLQNKLKNRW